MDESNQEKHTPDPFTSMMFGTGRRTNSLSNTGKEKGQPVQNRAGENTINYLQLMEVIDSMVGIADTLKPVFNGVYPYIQQFMKKK
ncbi:hypothetical protein [Bacillus sp. FJAT-27445]|uniref:hypothetical protein n=1 Tax=Bacillus sp. FJAT-27445 TaxID=1679166 RepID=UPI00074379AE|nr:hypothetical protein [Bacillus sp. FJAT-27445]